MSDIIEILSDIRPELDFASSLDFFEDGFLDSFDLLVLVSRLEEYYGTKIDGRDILPENFRSIDAIEKLLERMRLK